MNFFWRWMVLLLLVVGGGCSSKDDGGDRADGDGKPGGVAQGEPLTPEAKDARQAGLQFLQAWQQADAESLKKALTTTAAAKFDPEMVLWFGAGLTFRVNETKVTGDLAEVGFDLVSVISNGEQGQATLVLRRESGSWRVADMKLGGAPDPAEPAGLSFSLPMGLETTPLRMPYGNRNPGGEIEFTESMADFPTPDQPPAAEIGWTADPAQMQFPEKRPARGIILGREFVPDHFILRESGLGVWELALQVGDEEFFPDQAVQVLLHLDDQEVPAGVTCQIVDRRAIGDIRGQVIVSAISPGEDVPREKIFHRLLLNLEFDELRDGKLPGRIFVCTPDQDRSYVAGEFVATIEPIEAEPPSPAEKAKPRELVKELPPGTQPSDVAAIRAFLLGQQSDDGDYSTRTLPAIGQLGTEVIPTLIQLLQDEHPFVRKQAADSLGDFGPAAEPAVPALIVMLEDKKSFLPGQAAEALGAIGPGAKSAAPALLQLMERGEVFSLAEAAAAFQAVGGDPKQAERALIEVLRRGKANTLRSAAVAWKLFEADTSEAVPILVKLAQQRGFLTGTEAVEALGELGPAAKEAGPVLLEILETSDGMDRERTAEAIGKIGINAKTSVPMLVAALESADSFEQGSIIVALGHLGPDASAAVPKLIRFVGEGNFQTKDAAIRALGKIGPAAEAAIPQLSELAKSQAFPHDQTALEALAQMGPAAVPSLVELLQSPESSVVRKACQAIGKNAARARIADRDEADQAAALAAAIPALLQVARSGKSGEEEAIKALGEIGPAAVPALVELLEKGERARLRAAEALGNMGPAAASAANALRAAQEGGSSRFQEAAQQALQQIEADDPD